MQSNLRNAGLEEAQAGIKISKRNINNLRYSDDTTLMAESEEELYKTDVHVSDNHDGVFTHLEPDILECEVKWALGNITMNKLVEVMEFQFELLQILK